MRPQAGVDRLKPVPPMHANDLPVVGQALSFANRTISHVLTVAALIGAVAAHRVAHCATPASGFIRRARFFFLDAAASMASTGFWYPVQRHRSEEHTSELQS